LALTFLVANINLIYDQANNAQVVPLSGVPYGYSDLPIIKFYTFTFSKFHIPPMKNRLVFILLLVSLFIIGSCKKTETSISGKWRLQTFTPGPGSLTQDVKDYELTLNANNTYDLTAKVRFFSDFESISENGTWGLSDGNSKIQFSNSGAITSIHAFANITAMSSSSLHFRTLAATGDDWDDFSLVK
jgi:hypothetical protein